MSAIPTTAVMKGRGDNTALPFAEEGIAPAFPNVPPSAQ